MPRAKFAVCGEPHIEIYESTQKGEEFIRVQCTCRIGRLHTYAEWAQLPENIHHDGEQELRAAS